MQKNVLITLILYGRVQLTAGSTLVCKCYHCTAVKTNYCTHTIHALTKCLKFARVEVIQETQKSPFHFLDI